MTKTKEAAAERLQKVLSRAGIGSRRQMEEMIRAGRVKVNSRVVTELGTKADPSRDRILVDDRPVRPPPTELYLALNKPTGVVTTLSDPEGRPTIRDFLGRLPGRVFPVGRLDYHSSGLLLLTNDGELATRLMHPRYGVEKTYRVKVRGEPGARALERLREGIRLEEGRTNPARVRVRQTRNRKTWLDLTIAEGKKHQVRRMCAAVGLPVEKLRRTQLGPIRLGKQPLGTVRPLTEIEVERLRAAVAESGRRPGKAEGRTRPQAAGRRRGQAAGRRAETRKK